MTKTKPEISASIGLDNLKHALKVTSAARSKSALPILACVHMTQTERGLAVEQTDLEIYVRVVMPELAGPAQSIVTPAEKLSAWTKLLEGESVTLTANENRASVRCGRAKATLPLFPADNWPLAEIYDLKANAITFTQGPLARALSFAQIAISEAASRYPLNGVQLHGDGERLSVVSTNGHCLMLYTFLCEDKIDLLIPARVIKALLPLLTDESGGVALAHDEHMILTSIDAGTKTYIGSPRMSGTFPSWRQVMPSDQRVDITLQVAEVLTSLDRAALLADERSGAVDLTFGDGELGIHAASTEHGEADEVIGYKGELENKFKTRVNVDYIRALMHKLSGEVSMSIPESNSALLFKAEPHDGETLQYVVMPMRM